MPARSKAKEPDVGSNPGNSDPIVGFGRDDTRNARSMPLGHVRLARDEAAVHQQLTRKVRVAGVDAAVDHGDRDPTARRDSMQVGEVPLLGGRLGSEERIVGRIGGTLCGVKLDRLRPGDARIMGNLVGNFISATFGFYFNLVIACVLGLSLFKCADRLGIAVD